MTQLGWRVRTLGEVALIQKGMTITGKTAVAGPVPVIAGGKQPAYFHNVSNREAGCVTVSASGAYAGFVSFHRAPIWASDCITLEPAEPGALARDFLHYFLLSKQQEIYGLQRGSGMPHVYGKDLAMLEISLPPLDEQRRIVATLEDHLSRLDKALAELANLRIRVDYLYQELISRTFWDSGCEVELASFGEWVTGGTPSTKNPEFFGGKLPFVTPPEVSNSGEVTSTRRTLSPLGATKVRTLHSPAIHIVCIGTVGKLGFSRRPSSTNQQINSLMPNALTNFDYALALFGTSHAQRLFREASGKSNMPLLNKSSLLQVRMPLPTLAQQSELLAASTELDQARVVSLNYLDSAVRQLSSLRRSLLKTAFEGNL